MLRAQRHGQYKVRLDQEISEDRFVKGFLDEVRVTLDLARRMDLWLGQ